MIFSDSRREAMPAEARNFCRRTPSSASGVVAVALPLGFILVVLPDLVVPIARIATVPLVEGRGLFGGRSQGRENFPELLHARQVGERVQAEMGQELAGRAVEDRLAHHLFAPERAGEL